MGDKMIRYPCGNSLYKNPGYMYNISYLRSIHFHFSFVICENVDKAWTKVKSRKDNVAGMS